MSLLHEVWTALVHVREREGSGALEGRAGAYFNVYILATSREDLEERVANWTTARELVLVEMEDIQPFAVRAGSERLSGEAFQLAQEASASRDVVADTFQRYVSDEDPVDD